MSRTVAIVGRPNVGKSALFNRLAGRKISIVHDMPGVTRDRITATCKLASEPFTMIDTGGIGSDVDTSFTEQVRAEVEIALAASDLLLFVVDAKDGLSPIDLELARGAGIPADMPETPVKIAIVGRPNVGKSSLTNAILNDQRTLVSPISGTTRDAIDIPYERHGNHYVLIDTAGIRPRGKVDNSVEVFSVMRSEKSIRRADLCCLVIDATAGVTAQDKKIAGMIQEERKPCIVAVNKWDLIKERTADKESLTGMLDEMRAELFFLDYAPVMLVSAKTGAEMTRLFKMIERIRREAQTRIGTGVLNRLLRTAFESHPPASKSGKRFKLLFATQPEPREPSILPIPELVLFVNDEKLLVESYRRFLEARIREHTPYTGLPLILHFRARAPRKRE